MILEEGWYSVCYFVGALSTVIINYKMMVEGFSDLNMN